MHPRLRLDIELTDLAHASLAWAAAWHSGAARAGVEARWGGPERALACLSVRSGLDLYLTALALPRGSEVLVSALTIRGMLDVLEAHGLVAVPLDLELDTMLPRPATLRAAAGPRARLVLVAQLFGARADLQPLADEARRLGLPLLEDCAQAWLADGYAGHPVAAAAFFSFGLIKSATALGGAVVVVSDAAVLARMRALEREQPAQPRAVFTRRLAKALAFTALSPPRVFGAFARWCARGGRDLDRVLHGSVRGFAAHDLLNQLRRRPSAPMLALLDRRLARYPRARLDGRAAAGALLAARLGDALPLPSRATAPHGNWVFPVLAPDPDALVRRLRDAGFDATRVSSLIAVDAPPGRPELEPVNARAFLARVVFLPAGAHVPPAELEREARVVRGA